MFRKFHIGHLDTSGQSHGYHNDIVVSSWYKGKMLLSPAVVQMIGPH
jgi:hypothetical protein